MLGCLAGGGLVVRSFTGHCLFTWLANTSSGPCQAPWYTNLGRPVAYASTGAMLAGYINTMPAATTPWLRCLRFGLMELNRLGITRLVQRVWLAGRAMK